jgi:hypothetical protein
MYPVDLDCAAASKVLLSAAPLVAPQRPAMRKREGAFGAIPQIKNAHPVTKHHPDVLWRRSRLWLRGLQSSSPDRGSWRGPPDRWKQMGKKVNQEPCTAPEYGNNESLCDGVPSTQMGLDAFFRVDRNAERSFAWREVTSRKFCSTSLRIPAASVDSGIAGRDTSW